MLLSGWVQSGEYAGALSGSGAVAGELAGFGAVAGEFAGFGAVNLQVQVQLCWGNQVQVQVQL